MLKSRVKQGGSTYVSVPSRDRNARIGRGRQWSVVGVSPKSLSQCRFPSVAHLFGMPFSSGSGESAAVISSLKFYAEPRALTA